LLVWTLSAGLLFSAWESVVPGSFTSANISPLFASPAWAFATSLPRLPRPRCSVGRCP
jgi:hypothetical protein